MKSFSLVANETPSDEDDSCGIGAGNFRPIPLIPTSYSDQNINHVCSTVHKYLDEDDDWGRSAEDMILDSNRQLCPLAEWKVLTRVIGCHSRSFESALSDNKPEVLNVNVGSNEFDRFNLVRRITMPGNISLLIAEEPMKQFKRRSARDLRSWKFSERNISKTLDIYPDIGTHTIFALNWFSPKSLKDYLSLGLRLLTQRGLETKFQITGPQFLQIAEDLLWSPAMLSYLSDRELKHTLSRESQFYMDNADSQGLSDSRCEMPAATVVSSTSSEDSRDGFADLDQSSDDGRVFGEFSNVKLITCTGFSMGGATGHVLAYLLQKVKKFTLPIRSIGFGSPRPGGAKLTNWFTKSLALGSCNVVLCRSKNPDFKPLTELYIDPATTNPSLRDGYVIHPIMILMDQESGLCHFVPTDDIIPPSPKSGHRHKSVTEADTSMMMHLVSNTIPGISPLRDQLWKSLHSISIYYQTICKCV